MGCVGRLPPGDLQIELHSAQIIYVHSQCLGKWAEQIQHFTRHTAHHNVIRQAFQFCHLDNQRDDQTEMISLSQQLAVMCGYLIQCPFVTLGCLSNHKQHAIQIHECCEDDLKM